MQPLIPHTMRLAFIDTETTGLARPGTEPTGRVIEFCCLPVDVSLATDNVPRLAKLYDQKVHFRLKLTEEDLATADTVSLEVNGYHKDTRPTNSTTSLTNTETLRLWQLASDAMAGRILVAQNVAFDIQFIEKELRLYGLGHTKRWQRKHVELWSLSLLAQLTEPSYCDPEYGNGNALDPHLVKSWGANNIMSLSSAAKTCDDSVDLTKAHTADGDVEFGVLLFNRFLQHMTWF